jgi:hypothetical protein
MKIKISSILKTIAFLAVTSVCIYGAMIVVRDKESDYKYADFFDRADQIDVLFIGSSHVINAMNPATLFDEFGYTSYNMGGHGSIMQTTYWELREVLQFAKPKVVVIDTYMLQKDYKYLDEMNEDYDDDDRATSVAQLHLNMDCWPLNDLKREAIKDLIKDEDIQKQFLADFYIYHNRWEELTKDDYKTLVGSQDRSKLFGAEMRYGIELTPGIFPPPEDDEGLGGDTIGEEYLCKIIEECQANNIDVIVTFLSCTALTDDKRAIDSARIIAEDYGVPFIDMLDEGVVDLYTDLNDTGHMNALGAIKATRYIGDVLSGRGGLTDHRGDEAYSYWQERADAFNRDIYDMAVNSSNIYQQLNYLSNGNVSSIVYINDESEAFSDEEMKRLIHNFTATPKIYHTEGPYILVNDVKYGEIYEASGSDGLDGITTSMGRMHYQPVEHFFRLLYTDEDPDTNYLYDDAMFDYDIQIITYDNETGEVLSHNYYKSYGCNYAKG